MDDPRTQRWYLRKHEDGAVFGPISFEQLENWAGSAQIAPNDSLSADQASWVKAPMLPQLAMDWLVEITSERYYGPTTLGAIQEFVRLGDIDANTCIINACDGSRLLIHQMPELLAAPTEYAEGVELRNAPASAGPEVTGLSIAAQEKIRGLEESLAEERRALREMEQRYAELAKQHTALVEQHAHSGRSS
jgi:hypothetical protein